MSQKSADSTTPASFHHARLSDPRALRTITLLPSSDLSAPLDTCLRKIHLDNVSKGENGYEALSYVWGSRYGTEPIQCEGKRLLVTPNCESALRHLRKKASPRVLWIDAICIDQEENPASVEERNSQVALMGEIYKSAVRTIFWFGHGNDYSDELMGHLNRIGTCPSQRGLKKFLHFDETLRENGQLDADSTSLNSIFSHPWHSRIWTVQEAAYSQLEDCEIMCGGSSIPWDVYSAAARFLIFEEFIEELDPQAHKSYVGIDLRNTIRDFLHATPSTDKPMLTPEDEEDERDRRVVFLSSCLSDVNQLQATEPRDKIYGLYALYTDLEIPLPAANYEKSLVRVFEEATVAMIAWSGTLKILGDVWHSRERKTSFPSWVPDWSDGNVKIFTPSGDATAGSRVANPSQTALNPTPGELHLQGKVVGTVLPGKNKVFTEDFPTRPDQCAIPILTVSLDGLVEDVETLRLWIAKTMFFRQLYKAIQTDPEICSGEPSDPEDLFSDILNQSSYSEPDETFHIWLDVLNYPDTDYNLSRGEEIAQKWRAAEEMMNKPRKSRWTTELTSCAVIMASLLSNSIYHPDGRMLNQTPLILDLVNQFSANLAD
ncbi:HET-domain-containing protein [Aulographum hederae CBS 113979]|uniref:HET-domain-containing protein n=1 Tax=Aulographum hederae CBS 113979 TaxID=1176131 RepID=A0A6G1HE15_9PEZI|nr:HET-domain-containing protein [Aulographum hederae CBS 113979]